MMQLTTSAKTICIIVPYGVDVLNKNGKILIELKNNEQNTSTFMDS